MFSDVFCIGVDVGVSDVFDGVTSLLGFLD